MLPSNPLGKFANLNHGVMIIMNVKFQISFSLFHFQTKLFSTKAKKKKKKTKKKNKGCILCDLIDAVSMYFFFFVLPHDLS